MPEGKKRTLLGELLFQFQWTGLSKAHSQVDAFTSSVKDMQENVAGTTNQTKSATRATLDQTKAEHPLYQAMVRAFALHDRISDKLGDVLDNRKQIYDLTEDELKQMHKSHEAYKRLFLTYEKLVKAGEMASSPELEQAIATKLKQYSNLNDSLDNYNEANEAAKKKIGALIGVINKLGEIGKDTLEGMFGGVTDTTGGVQILRDTYGKFMRSLTGGHAITKKLWGGVQEFIARRGAGIGRLGKSAQKLSGSFKKAGVSAKGFSGILTGLRSTATNAGAALVRLGPVAIGLAALLIVALPVIVAVSVAITAVYAAIQLLKKGFVEVNKTQDEFRLTNYRAAGSIAELTNTTIELSRATKISMTISRKSIKALVEAGYSLKDYRIQMNNATITSEQFQKRLVELGQTHVHFTHATGASAKETAIFMKGIDALNIGADRSRHFLGQVSVNMRDFGMTGTEATGVLDKVLHRMRLLKGILKPDALKQYGEEMVRMAASAKLVGVDTKTAAGYLEQMSDVSSKISKLGFIGGDTEFMRALDEGNLEAAAKYVNRGIKTMQAQAEASGVIVGEQIKKNLGLDDTAMVETFKAMTRIKTEAEKLQLINEAKEAKAAEVLKKAYDDSMNTLTEKWQTVFAPLIADAAEKMAEVVEWIKGIIANIDTSSEYTSALVDVLNDVYALFDAIVIETKALYIEFKPLLKLLGAATFILVKGILVGLKFIVKNTRPFLDSWWSILTPFGQVWHFLKLINQGISKAAYWMKPFKDIISDVTELFVWLKEYLFGSSFLHIKEDLETNTIPAFQGLIGVIKVLAEWFEKIKQKASDFAYGAKEAFKHPGILIGDYSGLEAEKGAEALRGGSRAGFNKALTASGMTPEEFYRHKLSGNKAFDEKLRSKIAAEASSINTVKFTSNNATTSAEKAIGQNLGVSEEMLNIMKDSANNYDPNNKRTADALEELIKQKQETNEVTPFRSKSGFGEYTINWWANG